MVWAWDRFSREGIEGAFRELRYLEDHLGASLWCLQEPFLSTAAPREQRALLLSIIAWAARWESQRKSDRLRAKVATRGRAPSPSGSGRGGDAVQWHRGPRWRRSTNYVGQVARCGASGRPSALASRRWSASSRAFRRHRRRDHDPHHTLSMAHTFVGETITTTGQPHRERWAPPRRWTASPRNLHSKHVRRANPWEADGTATGGAGFIRRGVVRPSLRVPRIGSVQQRNACRA